MRPLVSDTTKPPLAGGFLLCLTSELKRQITGFYFSNRRYVIDLITVVAKRTRSNWILGELIGMLASCNRQKASTLDH
jgi:hypothetical protein